MYGEVPMMKRTAVRVLRGLIRGLTYYAIFAVLIPLVLSQLIHYDTVALDMWKLAFIGGVFIALGIVSSIVKPFVGVVLNTILVLSGLLLMLRATNFGTVEVTLSRDSATLALTFEFKPLLAAIVGLSIASATIDAFEKITTEELTTESLTF